MLWLSWRSQKVVLLTGVAVLALLAGWYVLTGLVYHHYSMAVQQCYNSPTAGPACRNAPFGPYFDYQTIANINRIALLAIPSAIGLVIGAPVIAREVALRTNRFGWTQAVTRTRWS